MISLSCTFEQGLSGCILNKRMLNPTTPLF
jgi:hypothetical protein